MLEKLIHYDQELLVYLNNLGSEQWDPFWFYVTGQFHWSPLFALILVLIFWKFGWKNGLLLLVFIAALVAFSDQFTNLIKNTFQRLRPCNEPDLVGRIRDFTYKPRGYGYYSGHAALSSTFTTLLILLLKKHFKFIWFLVLFPLIFGYSRIYLGVHYPLDVLSGYLAGFMFGNLFYWLERKLRVSTRFS